MVEDKQDQDEPFDRVAVMTTDEVRFNKLLQFLQDFTRKHFNRNTLAPNSFGYIVSISTLKSFVNEDGIRSWDDFMKFIDEGI